MVRFVVFALLLSRGLLAVSSEGQSSQQHPDTTMHYYWDTREPVVIETEVDTTLRFDRESGLHLQESSAQPQPPPSSPEPGAGESTKQRQGAGETFKLFQFLARQPFPVQFIGGLAIFKDGVNVALSYDLPKGIELSGYPHLFESFHWYPRLTLGGLQVQDNEGDESFLYGIIEGHRLWETENLRASAFLGVGLGLYQGNFYFPSYDEIRGMGLILSAGAQARVWRIMGDLRLYRTPGLGTFATVANVGYQPKSFKETLTLAGVGAGITLLFGAILIVLVGGFHGA